MLITQSPSFFPPFLFSFLPSLLPLILTELRGDMLPEVTAWVQYSCLCITDKVNGACVGSLTGWTAYGSSGQLHWRTSASRPAFQFKQQKPKCRHSKSCGFVSWYTSFLKNPLSVSFSFSMPPT